MDGEYMHAVMHIVGDGWPNIKRTELNIVLNAIVLGMIIASLTPDTAQKLLDDAEDQVPGLMVGMAPTHERIVEGVEHPELWDCLRDPPEPSPFIESLAGMFGAPPG